MASQKSQPSSILVVDDDKKILFAFREVLKRERYRCLTADNGTDALRIFTVERPSLVFMDIAMPDVDGLETLRRMKETASHAPVIMITGHGTMQLAIKAMQLGAYDYVSKPLDVQKIRELIHRALNASRATPAGDSRGTFSASVVDHYELIGHDAHMQDVYKLIGSVALTPSHTPVLITGESGTGKELVARAIHNSGAAASEPFVAINCTAVPETLLESELFGHDKGAFTGAFERKLGKFEIAGSGTIFLDEIGSLPLQLQQKLLRVLQEREFERLGGHEQLQVRARFIAATNVDLATAVQRGHFRKDLYFRLNVVGIHLPALRDRREDIPLLAEYFLRKYTERIKRPVKGFSSGALSLLQSYDYPGNVRQLENIIERAVIFSKGEVILPEVIQEPLPGISAEADRPTVTTEEFATARRRVLDAFEARFVESLLDKYGGNVTKAARASKMTRQNFQRLMNKHNVRSQRFR